MGILGFSGQLTGGGGCAPPCGPATGDLSGDYPNPKVIGIQGNLIQAVTLGPSQDGYILTWVNAAGLLEFKPPGTSITLSGDVTGPSGSNTVINIHGASVPAAGALTTGNVLQVNGASSLTYAPINLAGGANYVTGTLPTGNQAAQTMGGDVSGTTAAATVIRLQGRNVSAIAPSDGYVLTWSANNNDWEPITPAAILSLGKVYEFGNIASDVGGYFELESNATGTEADLSVAISNGSGKTLIKSFASNLGSPNVTYIPAGQWDFDFYRYVSSATGTTQLIFDVFIRTALGVETLLFSATTPDINDTTVTESTLSYSYPVDTDINATDRIVVEVSAITTAGSTITVHFVFDGATHASHVHTPIPGAAININGDVTGNTGNTTVGKLRGKLLDTSLATIGAAQDGYVLTWINGSVDWQAKPLPTSLPPNGAAGGDLSGTYPNPNVIALRGKSLDSSLASIGSPQDGYVLTWVNAANDWQAIKPSAGGGSIHNITVSGLKTATYNVQTSDYMIAIGTLSGAISINLPASPSTGDRYEIKDVNGTCSPTNTITITPNSGNIDGQATHVMATGYNAVVVTYTGSQWSVS